MARGDLNCPVCGANLGLPNMGAKNGTDIQRDGEVGGHIHWTILADMTCTNGHRWHFSGDLIMERVS